MDRTVPAPAAILLDAIGRIETGKTGPEGYEVIYAHKQHLLKKPLTQWTLDEVEADGPRRTKAYGSSAAGRYQFMRDTLDKPGTLADIEGEMGLTGKEKMTPDLQDRMGFHLLKRRGYERFVSGKLGTNGFALNLAKEWASFPVLTATKGAKRQLTRGQSYYAGDGLNKSLVQPEEIESLLASVLREVANPSLSIPAANEAPNGLGALLASLIKAILAFFAKRTAR